MRRHKRGTILWILIPILVVGALGCLFFHYFLDPDLYKKILEESLTKELRREVVIREASISLWDGIGIAFEGFQVRDSSLSFDLLHAKRLILKIKIFPLLKGQVKWRQILLDQPSVRLSRDQRGRFNIADGSLTAEKLQASQQKILQILLTLFGGSLALRDGRISFSDESLGPTALTTEIIFLNLQLSEVSHQKPFPFRLSGTVRFPGGKEGRFSVAGTILDIPEDMDFSKGRVDAKVEAKGIETLHFWPYLKTFLPMETISGDLDLNAHYQGTFRGAFKTSVNISVRELVFDYPKVFAYVFRPKWMNIDLMVDYDLKDLNVPQVSIELPELSVKARGKIYEIGSEGMGLDAEAQSAPFDLAEGKKFIPFRIITPEVSQPLFRAEGSGPVEILSVRLSGKISEIEHCDLPAHAHTLSVEMKASGARLKLPWNLPPLRDVRGHLSFKNGHLHLEGVEGKVFHSHIDRAHGTFYELLLVPTLQVHSEGRIDLKDLPSLIEAEGFSENLSAIFSPIQNLSGRADYRLFARVVLKAPLRFQHEGSYRLKKVRFDHQQIPFPIVIGEGRLDLSDKGLQWSGAKVEFGSSSFLLNGLWKSGEQVDPLEMEAKGTGELKDLFILSQSPLLSEKIRLKMEWIEDLSGTADLSFRGRGHSGLQFSTYEGEVIPRGVHLLPRGARSPIIFEEGRLLFSNLGVNVSKIKALSDTSSLTLDGTIREERMNLSARGSVNLKHFHSLLSSPFSPHPIPSGLEGIQELSGEARVHLKLLGRMEEGIALVKEGEVYLKEASLKHQKVPVSLSHIEGSLVLSSEEIRFDRLRGTMGTSPVALWGSLSRSAPEPKEERPSARPTRRFAFRLSSPQLDLDPLFPKEELTSASFEKLRNLLSRWSLDGKVEANEVSFRDSHYREFKTEMKSMGDKLLLSPLHLKGFGGDLWGEGWIQPTQKGIQFEIKPRISNLEAKGILRTLLQKGEEEIMLTGRVHIDKMELRGAGEGFQQVKESLNGRLRLEVENGMIERWKTLSRIFSILNVSQWFWGRLPDLKTKGLPFRQIRAHVEIKDGVATTEDFIVQSDAIRITLLGKIDLVKNQIDATVGVHPLVTVDMVLSHLPIAGYILTGKDRAFLSYVYEVKGNLDAPQIEPVPIKGLGENFWGMVRRLLETPMRPFQRDPNNKE